MAEDRHEGWTVMMSGPNSPQWTPPSIGGFLRSLFRPRSPRPFELPPEARLIARRLPDGRSSRPFAVAYYCTSCRDHFGLTWYPPGLPLPDDASVVEPDRIPAGMDPRAPHAFCPVCGTPYPGYGLVYPLGQASGPLVPRTSFFTTYPAIAPETSRCTLSFGEQTFPLGVVVLSGTLPAKAERRAAVCGLVERVAPELRPADGETGCSLFVVHADRVSNQASEIDPTLRGLRVATKDEALLLMLSPIATLPPPLCEGMMCFVRPYAFPPGH